MWLKQGLSPSHPFIMIFVASIWLLMCPPTQEHPVAFFAYFDQRYCLTMVSLSLLLNK